MGSLFRRQVIFCACCCVLLPCVSRIGAHIEDIDNRNREFGFRDVNNLASVNAIGTWIAHPVVGEASFDAFVHSQSNPIYTGSDPDLWPVNGFLFNNDATANGSAKNQTLYIGLYGSGYSKPTSMLGLGTTDGGATWHPNVKNPLVCSYNTTLFGKAHGCPDGSAVSDGRGGVHMVFDWSTSLGARGPHPDNGLGYQHCVTPLGPCAISDVPVNAMTNNSIIPPAYRTTYGGTLLKRDKDWLVLTAISTAGNAGGIWGLAALTSATAPEGPYTAPVLLLHPESDRWHPHPCEFYPCFSYDHYAYCPCTSLNKNRAYQVLYRAPLEAATQKDAWEVFQAGSLYHWGGEAASASGIWGQTFTGFVSPTDGALHIMYPSKNADNVGTINLARAPGLLEGLVSDGFWVGGPNMDAIAIHKNTYSGFRLNAVVTVHAHGLGWSLRWNYRGEIGPAPTTANADAVISPRAFLNNSALCFDGNGHVSMVLMGDAHTPPQYLLRSHPAPTTATVLIEMVQNASSGVFSVSLNGTTILSAQVPNPAVGGSIAVHATTGASVYVSDLTVATDGGGSRRHHGMRATGDTATDQRWFWLTPGDGIAGGGCATVGGWQMHDDPTFRTGSGFLSAGGAHTMAKWNFDGIAARLWLPRGPTLGTVVVAVDGNNATNISLFSASPTAASVVYEWREDTNTSQTENSTSRWTSTHFHALTMRWNSGAIVVDSLQFLPDVLP